MSRRHLFSWLVIGLFATAAARAQSFVPRSGPELVANVFADGPQSQPALAVNATDGFAAAWREGGEVPGGIRARRFDATGSPLGGEIMVDASGVPGGGPRVASALDGRFAVVWSDAQDVWLRRYDRDGQPLDAKLRVNDPGVGRYSSFPDLAMTPDGAFVVVWRQDDPGLSNALFASRFDNGGGRSGSPFQVAPGGPGPVSNPRLAVTHDGGFLAVWQNNLQVAARRFGAHGSDAPPAVRVDGPQTDKSVALAPPLVYADRTAAVVWASDRGLLGRRLDEAGALVGEVTVISPSAPAAPLAVAADPAGNAMILGGQGRVLGLLFDRALVRRSDLFRVGGSYIPASEPALVARYSGGFVALWTSGFVAVGNDLRPSVPGTDGNALGVAGQLFGPVRCPPGSDLLCLGPDGRFEARLEWKDPDPGETGAAHPLHLTQDTGAFWFFSDQNLELMVKVVDGTGLNDHFWIYTGALSNVEYTLTVTDTVAGTERVYHNPPFKFGNVGDVDAFAATPDFLPPEEIPVSPLPATQLAGCPPVSSNLCLDGGRFAVAVDFNDPRTGLTVGGRAVPLTADTGAFWFFNDANLELMVKVLDGRTVNGKFWVFYGALSDVDYTIHVRNLATGVIKDYHNPKGTLASRADIQAF